jgi:hypothetical protein
MVHAVHHVRGRLRIRNLAIKGSRHAAVRYRDVVRCLPGVYAATARARTGSIVIEYDPSITDQAQLCQLLGVRPAGGAKPVEKLVEKLGQVLIERLIERAFVALI